MGIYILHNSNIIIREERKSSVILFVWHLLLVITCFLSTATVS